MTTPFPRLIAIAFALIHLVHLTLAHPDTIKPFSHRKRDVTASQLPDSMVASAWYAGWLAPSFPISDIPWSKYTKMTYAFAITTSDDTLVTLMEPDQVLLREFVSAAHENNVKASLSIGGWTGSRFFSSHIATSQNRTAFVRAVVDIIERYDLDGIDIDWEYPNFQGIGCNIISSDDTPNLLSFLQELRSTPAGSDLILTASTLTLPFNDTSGQPSTDMSGFSQVLDYITVMNYDIKSTPQAGAGPHSPLDDSCAPPASRFGSALSAVNAWTAAGMPANQIVLGVPAYGNSRIVPVPEALPEGSTSTTLVAYPRYDPNVINVGPGSGELDVCGVQQTIARAYTYQAMIEDEFLTRDGEPAPGVVYRFDECSQTPFVYQPGTQIFVSYDNAQSFAIKGSFIKQHGLRGFAMWQAGGDYNNVLVNSILNATIYAEGGVTSTGGTSGSGESGNVTSTGNGASAPGSSNGQPSSFLSYTTAIKHLASIFFLSLSSTFIL